MLAKVQLNALCANLRKKRTYTLVELRRVTNSGYIGVVDEVTHPLVLSPGLTNENTLVVRATVSMSVL